MPNWKKVITSGSNASLNTLTVTNGVIGNVIGTSSYSTYAETSSYSTTLGASFNNSAGGTLRLVNSAGNSISAITLIASASITSQTASYSTTLGASLDSSTIGNLKLLNSDGVTINTFSSVTATTASLAFTASYVQQAISSSFATTASYVLQAVSASYAPGGGSGTVNSGIAGYVAYYPTTTTTVDDTNGLYWDQTNSRLGIGNASPTKPLEITGQIKSSTGYVLGSDLSLVPIVSGQSAVTTWWGMQLVGNKQSTVDYTPSNIGSAGDFSVIIPNQQAGKIGLIVKGQTAQTGNLLELRNVSNTGLSAFDSTGQLSIGKTTPTATLDVNGSTRITGSLNVTGGITGSLFGTATTASYFSGTVVSASYAVSASFAPTAGNISAAVNLFNYYNFT